MNHFFRKFSGKPSKTIFNLAFVPSKALSEGLGNASIDWEQRQFSPEKEAGHSHKKALQAAVRGGAMHG